MPKCMNCGYEYETKHPSNYMVVSCNKCQRRFKDKDINLLLNKYYKGGK